jgi:hypothetical protein
VMYFPYCDTVSTTQIIVLIYTHILLPMDPTLLWHHTSSNFWAAAWYVQLQSLVYTYAIPTIKSTRSIVPLSYQFLYSHVLATWTSSVHCYTSLQVSKWYLPPFSSHNRGGIPIITYLHVA